MIQSRDYSSLDQLLNIEELSPLHLYIFLLAWTHVRTVNDANVLHDSINLLKNKNPILIKCLELFQSHIDFITWLHNVRRYVIIIVLIYIYIFLTPLSIRFLNRIDL